MSALLHSPAAIIARLLIDTGYGDEESNVLADWPMYIGSDPDMPDNVLVMHDMPGVDHGRMSVTGKRGEHHGVEIKIRALTHQQGYAKSREIAIGMDKSIYQETVNLDGTSYLIHSINRTTDVIALGKEATMSRRSLFAISALVSIKVVS